MKSSVQLIVNFDPAHGSAGASLVDLEGKPKVLASILDEHGASNLGLASLSQILSEVSSFAASHAIVPANCFCLIAPGEHLSLQSRIIRSKGSEERVITKALLESLVKEARSGEENGETLERRIVHVTINGYHTATPIGKRGREVALSVLETKISNELKERIRSVISRHFHLPIFFEALSTASFIAIRNYLEKSADFLVVTLGGEHSELSLVKDFSILQTVPLSFGNTSFIGNMDHNYFSHLNKGIAELGETSLIPDKIYIIAEEKSGGILSNFLRTNQFLSSHSKNSNIEHLLHPSFEDHLAYAPGLKENPLVSLSALFATEAIHSII